MVSDSKALLDLRQETRDFALSPLPPMAVQHAWFKIARERSWSTLAVVPINDSITGLSVARGMGQMAGQEPGQRVLLVDASIRRCGPAGRRSPIDAQGGLDDLGNILSEGLQGRFDFMDFSLLPVDEGERALALAPQLLAYASRDDNRYSTVIMNLDSPLTQTRAIPAARAADAVIICVSMNATSFSEANDVVEMIGRDRVIGSMIVNP